MYGRNEIALLEIIEHGVYNFHRQPYNIESDERPTVSMSSSLVDVLQRYDMARVNPRLWARIRRRVNSKQKRLNILFEIYCHEVSKFFTKSVIDNKFAKISDDDDDGLFAYLETQSLKTSIVSWKAVHYYPSYQQSFESATDFLQHQIDIHDASKQLYTTNRTMPTLK